MSPKIFDASNSWRNESTTVFENESQYHCDIWLTKWAGYKRRVTNLSFLQFKMIPLKRSSVGDGVRVCSISTRGDAGAGSLFQLRVHFSIYLLYETGDEVVSISRVQEPEGAGNRRAGHPPNWQLDRTRVTHWHLAALAPGDGELDVAVRSLLPYRCKDAALSLSICSLCIVKVVWTSFIVDQTFAHITLAHADTDQVFEL